MKKVLGIFCHPDDEVLFGWPIFQSDEYEKHLVICCDDSLRNRPGRKKALQEVCKQENINLVSCLSEDNNFYALPTRRADYLLTDAINRINVQIEKAIIKTNPDFIFTHSPVGEYGHGSHRLLFEIVSQHPLVKNLLITDICEESNHRSSKEIPKFIWDRFYSENLWRENAILDEGFYLRCRAAYNSYNSWTWCKDPIPLCNLYSVKNA